MATGGHRIPSSLLRWGAVSFVLAALLAPNPARPQSVSETLGKTVGANEEVINAAGAAEEALKTWATDKRSRRGASGAIASLLTSSDELICSAWIISFRSRYRDMIVDGADAKTLRAMEHLMEVVEKGCDKILSPGQPAATAVGGGGKATAPEEEEEKPIYPNCPQCDPLKRLVDRRTDQYRRAQYELAKAMRVTDFVEAAYKAGKKELTHGETPKSAETFEAKKRAEVDNTKRRLDQARAKLVKCLEKCNTKMRKKYAFFGNNPTTYALAGGAVVAGGLLLTRGGNDESTPQTPSATPTPEPSGPSYAMCAGTYNVTFDVTQDPGGHRYYVGMPRNRQLSISFASIHIRGEAPFVDVSGSIDASNSFEATGMGTVAGYANVSVRMTGRLSGCTSSAGTLTAEYSMGANGELPGGQAITYSANGSK